MGGAHEIPVAAPSVDEVQAVEDDKSAAKGTGAVIVDLGIGNVGSLANMCAKLGYQAELTSDPERVINATHVLLPGVGAFDHGMRRLERDAVADALRARARCQRKLLGICLGMQLLFDCSDEGVSGGLGIIPGRVCRLPGDTTSGHVRIPHMGWNTVCVEKDSLLTASLDARSRFYFVHSFAAVPSDSRDVLGRTIHGEPFVSMVEHGGVCGVQFHPEKSHRHGAALLRAFLSL